MIFTAIAKGVAQKVKCHISTQEMGVRFNMSLRVIFNSTKRRNTSLNVLQTTTA